SDSRPLPHGTSRTLAPSGTPRACRRKSASAAVTVSGTARSHMSSATPSKKVLHHPLSSMRSLPASGWSRPRSGAYGKPGLCLVPGPERKGAVVQHVYFILAAVHVLALVVTGILWAVIDLVPGTRLKRHFRDVRAVHFGSLYLVPWFLGLAY